MSKYKTIVEKVNKQSLEEAIQNRLLTNRITRMALNSPEVEKALMSTNKSIIYIKLPKKTQKNSSFFRSSLYQSSLKRLKKQKVTIIKQNKIPSITCKKTFQSFQQDALRKSIKQKHSEKKDHLPHVYNPSNDQEHKNGHLYPRGLQQKIQEVDEDEKGQHSPQPKHQRNSTFEMDGSLIFKNLKQKYLELRQLSLSNKRKSVLLDKNQNKKTLFEDQFLQYDSRYKMDKQIMEHMNRYMKKDFFQTKVNGLRTIIYPTSKSQHHKKEIQFSQRRKQHLSNQKDDKRQFSNFIKRKKLRNHPLNISNEYAQSSFQLRNKQGNQNQKSQSNNKPNPEVCEKGNDCTPWETDFISFE